MIRHVVMLKFHPEVSEDERQAALAMVRELPEKIDFIRGFEAGADVLKSPRSWDAALVATFDDLDALARYARHEDHVPVVMHLQKICAAIAAVDFETP